MHRTARSTSLHRSSLGLFVALVVSSLLPAAAAARTSEGGHLWTIEGDCSGPDLPARVPAAGERADTLSFGYVQTIGGELYAVQGETWTFDHGAGGPEGWYAVDLSVAPGSFARRIDAASWAVHGNGVVAPIITGAASIWIGAYEDEADALCWQSGLGYGSHWCQRWVSPPFAYNGADDVSIDFDYFSDSELGFDGTKVRLELAGGQAVALNGDGFEGEIGDPASHSFVHASYVVPEADFEGESSFALVFEFTSDGGWSDQDGEYNSTFGPFGVDDVVLGGPGLPAPAAFDFESGTQGWTNPACAPVGSFFGIHSLSEYTILDPCGCNLANNVLGLHEGLGDAGTHPYGQNVMAISPPADKTALGAGCYSIIGEWDQYSVQPQANGVFNRPGWNYYPFVCPTSGVTGWSGRSGLATWNSTGVDPACFHNRNVATDAGIPADVQLVSFVWEVYSSCDAFGIAPSVCTHTTNFTPLIDNVAIRVVKKPCAPVVSFDPGTYFQDGFSQAPTLTTTGPGNADITYDLARRNGGRSKLGDSLLVKGPVPTSSTKWESKLWFRVRREGPAQTSNPGYVAWKSAVSDGLSIVGAGGQFTAGRMDSAQSGVTPYRNAFISEFREDDDDFVGELTDNNEMLRDGIFTPGTQVQYFITSNYTCTPSDPYFLPDTTGKNFLEFEILPSFRLDGGVAKLPAILTIDLRAAERDPIEHALNMLLNGAGPSDPVPNPTRWDRYDYNDACSCWNAPLARGVNSNNGVTIWQLLGYRQIVLYTGRATIGAMFTEDFTLFSDWLTLGACGSNGYRQGFLAAGDNVGAIIQAEHPSFGHNQLGLSYLCDAYSSSGCGPAGPADQSNCVRIESAPGALFPPLIDVDVTGNWCPELRLYDVLGTANGGVGNRVYRDYDRVPPLDTHYAQIVKSVTGSGSDNYRAVVDGYALGALSSRDTQTECSVDAAHKVPAITEELRAALEWTFGSGGGGIPGLLPNPNCTVDVGEEQAGFEPGVTRLFENRPNPFNPRTVIRFSLGHAGDAELIIYDVGGRAVRTLLSAPTSAGQHSLVWDGTDDHGRKLSAGIYWSQLRAGGYESQRKMLLIK